IFRNSEYGFARFEVAAPSVLPQQQRFRLTFRLLQWRWRLVAVTLPENIQNLLGDELAKALRTPVQNRGQSAGMTKNAARARMTHSQRWYGCTGTAGQTCDRCVVAHPARPRRRVIE